MLIKNNYNRTFYLFLLFHLIEYSNTEPIVYMKAVDSGIEFTARYLCPTKKRRDSENEFWEIASAWRNENLWKTQKNQWVKKYPVK